MNLKTQKINLPKPYISHSQIACVNNDPQEYIRKYFYGIEKDATIQQEFGKTITDILERRVKCPTNLKKALKNVPKYQKTDVTITAELARGKERITLLGRLDGLHKSGIQGEYKTGMVKWTQKRANESLQLKLYALIEFLKTKIIPAQELTWIPTKWNGAEIELCGDIQVFKVQHDHKTMLETQMIVWQAHDKIIKLIRAEIEAI